MPPEVLEIWFPPTRIKAPMSTCSGCDYYAGLFYDWQTLEQADLGR